MNNNQPQHHRILCRLFLTALLLGSWISHAIAEEVVVIVNKDNPTPDLEPVQISNLYLGRSRSFPNGERAHVIDQPRDSPLREKFYKRVNGMSLNQVNTYWARLTFSGRVISPAVQPDGAAALKATAEDANAISYVGDSTLPPSVSPVLRLHE